MLMLLIAACTPKQTKVDETSPITGTWQLLTGTLIENGDTTVTDYTSKISFIKIINQDHFAFLQHDLNKGLDTSNAVFVAGGGPYTLKDSVYTEHLEYCNDRAWEGHDFSFVITVKNDTLIQKGLEVIEEQGVNRMNVEVYKRL
jgi:hypothetical protein